MDELLHMKNLEGLEEHLSRFPAGKEMCRCIRAAVSGGEGMPETERTLWRQIGFDLVFCSSFPATQFQALLSQGTFDVRWPLTFAYCYLLDCGQSLNKACAAFLDQAGLWGQAHSVLDEYVGQWIHLWKDEMEELYLQRIGTLWDPSLRQP